MSKIGEFTGDLLNTVSGGNTAIWCWSYGSMTYRSDPEVRELRGIFSVQFHVKHLLRLSLRKEISSLSVVVKTKVLEFIPKLKTVIFKILKTLTCFGNGSRRRQSYL